jgi:plastocyanin
MRGLSGRQFVLPREFLLPREFWLQGVAAALGLAALMMAFAAGAADAVKISANNFMFAPISMMVSAGATVTWTNMDDEPHTVVSDTGLFRSGAIDTGESFSFRFDKPGTYHYTCSLHPRMVGTIVVQ